MKTLSKQETAPAKNDTRYLTPAVNIRENGDAYLLEAEMPGVTKDGLEILVENQELTILGNRAADVLPGEPVYRESHNLGFRRTFDLDPSIDVGKITAKMEQGVLTLTLPKAEIVKPRKITVE